MMVSKALIRQDCNCWEGSCELNKIRRWTWERSILYLHNGLRPEIHLISCGFLSSPTPERKCPNGVTTFTLVWARGCLCGEEGTNTKRNSDLPRVTCQCQHLKMLNFRSWGHLIIGWWWVNSVWDGRVGQKGSFL
jgi:hypothetical protein